MKQFLAILFIISSFHNVTGQTKKVVFPITIVVFSGIDTIYCFEDSLSENTKLISINTEEEFVQTVNKKLKTIGNLDSIYKPMIRLYAVWSEKSGTDIIPYERVFKYDSKSDRKIELWYRDEIAEKDNYIILQKLIKDRLKK
jgi:hypothetical protein